MIIISKIAKIDTTNKMTVAFDVSKSKLNYFAETKGKITGTSCREEIAIQDEVPNTTKSIIATFKELSDYASKQGLSGLHIACEPTGSYSDSLMRLAHQKGYTTAYLSGESVNKAKISYSRRRTLDASTAPGFHMAGLYSGKQSTGPFAKADRRSL